MATVPTNALEIELRKLYLQWLALLPEHMDDVPGWIAVFEARSRNLIAQMGGQVASLGALTGFPVPTVLDLSPNIGTIYNEMVQAGIQAGIGAGLQATDTARQLLNAGLDRSFRDLNRTARTETVSAYWKNQWDSVAGFGDEIVMIWSSEDGPKTCEYCLERDGLVVEDPDIRDHPNGRCTLIPTLRSRVDYKGTLLANGAILFDPAWTNKRRVIESPEAGKTGQSISSVDQIDG